jgi:hypothetical protein
MTTLRTRIASATVFLLLVATGGSLSARAGEEMYGRGEHRGSYGLHWILDAPAVPPEHPAVTCRYDSESDLLVSMLVRQPVLFADVSEGPQRQLVGWRAIVQGADDVNGPWRFVARSPVVKAFATGRYPADLPSFTIRFAEVPAYHVVRILYRLTWYSGDGKAVEGRASHRPRLYGLSREGPDSYLSDHCETATGISVVGRDGEGQHTGQQGLHWILDHSGPDPEYPAVTCEYGSQGEILRVRIRRPIAFARDAGPGVQSADVAGKGLIQSTPQNEGSEIWSTVGETAESTLRATDLAWADFLPKQAPIPAGGLAIRVVYVLAWSDPSTGTLLGTAEHYPVWYLVETAEGTTTWQDDHCLRELT